MQPTALQKITARHLGRLAMLYVRQSTLHQVLENTESTARQYGLRERAIALGWEASRIVVIDQDLGQSGASAVDRAGFQRLVAEVGLGHVGLVMGLEVSRLARSSLDWHHLLEICTMTGTLILDEDGLYDPATFNDRLLLGLKGTMSEAELHVLQARLKGGILHKASRAALKVPLPVGLAYAEDQTVILNPDAQIQQAVRLLFATFTRTGSACATVRYASRIRDCSSRAVFTSVLMQARFIGCLCNTTLCSKRCAILAMRELSASDGPIPPSMLMARCTSKPFPRSSGRFWFVRSMLDT